MKRMLVSLVAVALIAGLASASGIQDKKAADRYAALCGDYRFDLTAYGADMITARFFVENEEFFVQASTSQNPDALSAVEGQPLKFFIDDPDEGHWDFEFLKDAAGKVTKCRIVNAGMGIDATGDRIVD
jgi:hypothetical protein